MGNWYQLSEHVIRNQKVASSILAVGSSKINGLCVEKAHNPFLFLKIRVAIG